MTPGEEALREAARLESARIYSRTLSAEPASPGSFAERDDEVAYWRRRGQSVASIAFRMGVTKTRVAEALQRLGAA